MEKFNKIKWSKWPSFKSEEIKGVSKVVRSNQLFAAKEVKKFEIAFAKFIGVKYALGLGNATQALHLSLAALNIGEGDEVIVTSYSWISTASCILMQNAVPIFCDIEKESLGASPEDIENKISIKTKCIIITHVFGYPAKIDKILKISKKYKIPIVEDSSHAHGAKVNNKYVGSFGIISVFSLHQRKSLSVGDGGILCTNNKKIREKVYKLRSFGSKELSFNYRMTEFAGILGQIGLKKLNYQNKLRNDYFNFIKKNIKSTFLKVRDTRTFEYGVYYAVLIEIIAPIKNLKKRIESLRKLNLPIRKTWEPLNKHPHFNPSIKPARGLPWKSINYKGAMKNKKYKNLKFKNTEYYCPNRLMELYIHPPINSSSLKKACDLINHTFS